jgi:hypothetical protein
MYELIRFNYLHRDSGNWKKFGSKLFSNPENLSLSEIEQKIRQNLIDQEFFYPEKVGIKKFKFHRYLDDYSWYEFESVATVEVEILKSQKTSITDFIFLLVKMKNFEIFLMSDQPTTCPICGARTEVIFETFRKIAIQLHACMDKNCRFIFLEEDDNDFKFI